MMSAVLRRLAGAALLVLILAEAIRWLVLAPILQGEKLASLSDDIVLTALLAASAAGLKLVLSAVGLVPTLGEWWQSGAAFHG